MHAALGCFKDTLFTYIFSMEMYYSVWIYNFTPYM